MGLRLQDVPAAAGLRWVRQGFAECFMHPLGYASLFVLFMLGASLAMLIPLLGGALLLMAVPLLSLAFMMATAGAQQGLPVQAGIYLAPWQGAPPQRRRALLLLCIAYAVATVAMLGLCELIDGGRFDDLLVLLAKGDATAAQIQAAWEAPGLREGALARVVLSALLSVPFWHAPALVHWGGQSPAQALFSSTLAVWRSRGAFLLYSLGWVGALAGAGALSTLLLLMLGMGALGTLVMMPLALFFTTAFYASLYFCFRDCFGADDLPPPAA